MAKMSDSPRRKLFRPVPGQMDMVFFLITMLLLVIGLIMLFSASYANAYYLLGNSFHYISRQMLFAVPGVIAMYVISRIDYHIFHRLAYPLMAASLVMLVIVFFMPALNNAHRWIFIGDLINFQPSEIAKFSLVILYAHWMSINPGSVRRIEGLIPYGCVLGVIILLLIAEPHLSAMVIVVGMALIMLILGGLNLRLLGAAVVGGVPLGLLAIFVMGKWDLSDGTAPGVVEPRGRCPGRWLADASVALFHRFRRPDGHRHRQFPAEVSVPAGASERLYLCHCL